jgi:AcrR family transcriptional regulator
MARHTRAELQEQTRQRILDAAATLFAERGYTATTVEAIAELAGHTRSAVYKSVGGKEQLFLSAAARRGRDQQQDWQQRIRRARTDERRLSALADVFMADVSPKSRWGLAVTEFLSAVDADASMLDQVLRTQAEADRRGSEMVAELCASLGIEPELPARDLYVIFVALANGLATRAALEPGFDLRQTLTGAINLLLRPEPSLTEPART